MSPLPDSPLTALVPPAPQPEIRYAHPALEASPRLLAQFAEARLARAAMPIRQ